LVKKNIDLDFGTFEGLRPHIFFVFLNICFLIGEDIVGLVGGRIGWNSKNVKKGWGKII